MIPKNMPRWYQSVEERFTKLTERISRLEGEMIVMIALQVAIIGLLIKVLT